MRNIVLIILLVFTACKTSQPLTLPTGVYKVSVFYAAGEGKTFDMKYYEEKHMPMVASYLGANLLSYEIIKGVSGRTAADPAPYMAVGSFHVKDIDAYHKAIAEHINEIVADFQKYTNVQPTVQISRIQQVVAGKGK
ncbi:MAG: EthD family reductase [Chitinophagaceae bacterium]